MRYSFEDIVSERFIHTDLIDLVKKSLISIRLSWKLNGCVDPFLVLWPSEEIKADNGVPISGPILLDLPPQQELWSQLIRNAVVRTKAYALLMCEQREVEILLIFESQHGSHSWHLPIQNCGGSKLLGDPKEKANVDSVGLLWRRDQVTN